MNYQRIINAPLWILSEIFWYFKWWCKLFIKINCKLYRFGQLILECGIKVIDFYDMICDEIEVKIKNLRRGNELA